MIRRRVLVDMEHLEDARCAGPCRRSASLPPGAASAMPRLIRRGDRVQAPLRRPGATARRSRTFHTRRRTGGRPPVGAHPRRARPAIMRGWTRRHGFPTRRRAAPPSSSWPARPCSTGAWRPTSPPRRGRGGRRGPAGRPGPGRPRPARAALVLHRQRRLPRPRPADGGRSAARRCHQAPGRDRRRGRPGHAPAPPSDAPRRARTPPRSTPPRRSSRCCRSSSPPTSPRSTPGQERLAVVVEMTVSRRTAASPPRTSTGRGCRTTPSWPTRAVAAWLEGASARPGRRWRRCRAWTSSCGMQDRAAQALRKRCGTSTGRSACRPSESPGGLRRRRARRPAAPTRRTGPRTLIEDFMIAANGVTARFLAQQGLALAAPRGAHAEALGPHRRAGRGASTCALPAGPGRRGARDAFLAARRAADPERFPDLSLSVIKLMGAGEYAVDLPGQAAARPLRPGGQRLRPLHRAQPPLPRRRHPAPAQGALAGGADPVPADALAALARHCTLQEDAATKVERQVTKSAAALLLRARVGERFDALVTGVSDKGTWVRIAAPPVEGRVVRGFEGMDVGDRVRVELVRTDVDARLHRLRARRLGTSPWPAPRPPATSARTSAPPAAGPAAGPARAWRRRSGSWGRPTRRARWRRRWRAASGSWPSTSACPGWTAVEPPEAERRLLIRYPRPATVGERAAAGRGPATGGSAGATADDALSPCVFLGEGGCRLDYAARPRMCQSLEPDAGGACEAAWGRREAALAWRPHQALVAAARARAAGP